MTRTLESLRIEAANRLEQGRITDALKVYRLILEALPLDFGLRLAIGDLFARAGQTRYAQAIYAAAATHNIKAGDPLAAVVALKLLEQLGADTAPLMSTLVATYCNGSERLGRGVRAAPPDYSAPVRDDIDLDYPVEPESFALQTAQMAADLASIQNYPNVVPPVAIFSTLDRDAFAALLGLTELKRFQTGEPIIRQGLPGDAVYFLARGHVQAVRDSETDDGGTKRVVLAGLGPGSLFGEMALVSDEPRSASIICDTPADALELRRELVEQLASQLPVFASALARFTQERMINNLLNTNPLFAPFDESQRRELLSRFTGHDVPKGTIFLEQGAAGPGLYVILRGRAEVLIWNGQEYVDIAVLGPGDVAGEISLLHETPVSATVRTMTDATLLFLARELFTPLVDTIPDLLAHFNRMAERRIADTEQKLAAWQVEEEIEELDEADLELSEDDTLFI